MGFSHRRSVLRPLFRTLHGLLGYQRSSTLFDLSVHHSSVDLMPALLFPASPTSLVDSLDSKLWYHFGCRAAALASAAPRPLGSLFGSFSPRGARSKGGQQPDGRVAHNQKLLNILGVDTRTLATRV